MRRLFSVIVILVGILTPAISVKASTIYHGAKTVSEEKRGGAEVVYDFFKHPLRFIPFATSIANGIDEGRVEKCKKRIYSGKSVSDEEYAKCVAIDRRLRWEQQTTAWGHIVDFMLSAIVWSIWFKFLCLIYCAIISVFNL